VAVASKEFEICLRVGRGTFLSRREFSFEPGLIESFFLITTVSSFKIETGVEVIKTRVDQFKWATETQSGPTAVYKLRWMCAPHSTPNEADCGPLQEEASPLPSKRLVLGLRSPS